MSGDLMAQITGSPSGAPLARESRDFFEPRLGADLSAVRVHTGAQASHLAERLDARAFTVGSDIFFGRGEYGPQRADGQRLLAHELAHVIQPRVVATSRQPTVSHPQDEAEREATQIAADIASSRAGPTRPPGSPADAAVSRTQRGGPTLPRPSATTGAAGIGLPSITGPIDKVCDEMRRQGLLPAQKGVVWKGHPRPPHPTPCNTHPDAPYLEDPMIASGAKCRGVCGPDCASNCQPEPDRQVCVTNPDGVSHSICTYKGVQNCGTHAGCRDHDACYDWCSDHGEDSLWDACHRWCDLGCRCEHGLNKCVSWARGRGPFDGRMTFYDESISHVDGPFPGTCATVTPALLTRVQQYLDLKDPAEITATLARAPASERLHLLATPMATEKLRSAIGPELWPTAARILADSPSAEVPSLDEATVFLARRAIQAGSNLTALDDVLAALRRRHIIEPGWARWSYVDGQHQEDANTFFTWTDDPVAQVRRAMAPPSIELYPKAFASVGWLFSTMMHEFVHVQQVLSGEPKREFDAQGTQRPEFVHRLEVEAYLWEIEHAAGTGLIASPAQMGDLGGRLKAEFTGMTPPLQRQYRVRYDAAQERVRQVKAHRPQMSIDDARRTVTETSHQIAELLRGRPGHEAEVDAKIDALRKRRQAALVTVTLVDNPNLQVVRPGDPGTYRAATMDASGRVRYLYGSLAVGWHLGETSPSAYTLGEALGVDGQQMAVAGTAIQGRVHPFPPDVDFDEHLHIVAPTLEEAALKAAQLIIAGIRRISGGPVPGRPDLEFRHLATYPAGGVGKKTMSLGQVLREDGPSQLAKAIKVLGGGNLNTFWRGFLADGRFTNITRVVFISAETPGGKPLLTPGGNADFNLAYLEDPKQIDRTALGKFATDMCCEARDKAQRGHWLKAAKRAYNYFSTIGDIPHMTALEPVFSRPEAELEMHATVVEAVSYVLRTRDKKLPEPRTRILSLDEAQLQLGDVADRVKLELPGVAEELHAVAGRLQARPDSYGNLEQDPLLAERLYRQAAKIRRYISQALENQVRPVLDHTLTQGCPRCESRDKRRQQPEQEADE
jgi:hypothetical protein